jgi:hypothetical protein
VTEVEANTCDMVKVERMSGLMECVSLIDMISSFLRQLLLIISLRDVILIFELILSYLMLHLVGIE